MVLENFIIDTTITWDRVSKSIFEHPQAKPGRKLRVQVTNAGVIEDLTGSTLNLGWKNQANNIEGLDVFTAVDITKGLFEIAYTSGMLSNVGSLKASLLLIDVSEVTIAESNDFVVRVAASSVSQNAGQSVGSWTALAEILLNEDARVQNEAGRVQAELTRAQTFDDLVDSEMIAQNVATKLTEKELTYAPRMLSLESELADEVKKDFSRQRKAKLNPKILAYGDSNTRYYEGDRALAGSISHAYSSWIDRFCADYPKFYASTVINAGYPGETIGYGVTNYTTNVTNNAPDIVIIGFGTNNIKQSGNTLEGYLASMTIMIDNLLTDGIAPIVLGIPWFDPAYVSNNMDIYNRLPVWNEGLRDLCISKNVEFVDVYHMFLEDYAGDYYNDTPKRHYNKVAQKILAEEIFKRILTLNNLSAHVKAKFKHETFNLMSMTWVKSYPSTAEFVSYTIGIDPFECVKIPSGTSITINTKSRFAVCFYPRAIATASFSNSIGDVAITNTIDDGLYFPIKRVSGATNAYIGTEAVITITAVGGDLYIRKISIEENPYAYPTKTLPITPRYSKNFIPTGVNPGYKIYLTDLAKEIFYNAVGQWTDGSGYICVGSTADRTAAQVNVPIGFKFLDLETNLRYRWNGVDTWTSF